MYQTRGTFRYGDGSEMGASSTSVDAATRARHVLVVAALVTAVGILVAGTVARAVGGALTLAGWSLGIFGLHAFGRLGRYQPESAPSESRASEAASTDEGDASGDGEKDTRS